MTTRLRLGDRLRCSSPQCRLQVVVMDLGRGKASEALLRCSCGSSMKKSYEKPAAQKIDLLPEVHAADKLRSSRQ
jgi:hypothetical protein